MMMALAQHGSASRVHNGFSPVTFTANLAK